MKILCVDVGTGTQDIYLYDSQLDMENNFKLVLPSPTMIVHRQIKQATKRRIPILLSGVMMGGGPSAWAVEAHLKQGLAVFATAEAARTINDDLEAVREIGVQLVSEDEAEALPGSTLHLTMRDFDYGSIASVFSSFGVELDHLTAAGVAVFDHGNAPSEISDRKFRFNYLDERIRKLNRLSAFAYRAEDIPSSMTRLKSVAESGMEIEAPLLVMDSAPAAVLGATLDPVVAAREQVIIANVGNFHTLAFRLGKAGIEGLFEHHTGFLDAYKLEAYLKALADGSLRNEAVFNDQGHGALIYATAPMALGNADFDVVITGPRRKLFTTREGNPQQLSLKAYYPAPFGDMMISGCFGILAAMAEVMPELTEPIQRSLLGESDSGGTTPWDGEEDLS